MPRSGKSRTKDKWTAVGIVTQTTFFITSVVMCIAAIASTIFGFMTGYASKTVEFPASRASLTLSTPATIFIIYGIVGIPVMTVACLAAIFVNRWILTFYLVLVGLFILFDTYLGINMLFSAKAFQDFLTGMRDSMRSYGIANSTDAVGVFAVNPTYYWDRLQILGKCCGMHSFHDWTHTPIGDQSSLPYSCCNDEYIHKECGELILEHQDSRDHRIEDMTNLRGCLEIFPTSVVRIVKQPQYFGIVVAVLLGVSALAAVLLLCLGLGKKYKSTMSRARRNSRIAPLRDDDDCGPGKIEQGSDPDLTVTAPTRKSVQALFRTNSVSPEEVSSDLNSNPITTTNETDELKLNYASMIDVDHAPIKKPRM